MIITTAPNIKLGPYKPKVLSAWNDLVSFLQRCSQEPRNPELKEKSKCLVPAVFKDYGKGRTKKNIDRMAAIKFFDLDEAGWSETRIRETLDGITFLAHTTTQSRPEHQRWRIVVQLDREHTKAEHAALWKFFQELFGHQFDAKTKDASRASYLPYAWEGACNEFFVSRGEPLPVDWVIDLGFEPEEEIEVASVDSIGEFEIPVNSIFTEKMIEIYKTSPVGGRYYNMLLAGVRRCIFENWQIDKKTLATQATAISMAFDKKARPHDEEEAQHAIDYMVTQNVQTRVEWQAEKEREYEAKIEAEKAQMMANIARWKAKGDSHA